MILKKGIAFLLSICMMLSLAGCKKEEGESVSKNGDITLEFYAWLDEENIFTTLSNAYTQKHPNVKFNLHFVPSDDYETKLVTAFSGGADIDVFAVASPPTFASYWAKDQVLPLDDFITKNSTDTSGYQATFDALKMEGKAYVLPYKTSSWAVYYNKDIFDQAGVAYPEGSWTWEEYFETAGKLTQGEGANKIYGSLNFQPTSMWWRVPANSKGANNPMDDAMLDDWMESAKYCLDLTKAGYQPPYADLADEAGKDYAGAFLQGKYGMVYNGDWLVEMLNTAIKEGNEINYDIAPLPNWEGEEPETTGAPGLLMAAKNTKYAEVAFDFMSFCAGEEGAGILLENDYFPAWQSEETVKAYTEGMETPEHIEYIVNQKINSQVPCDPNYNSASNIVKEEVSLYLLEEQDLETTKANIKSRMDNEIKE